MSNKTPIHLKELSIYDLFFLEEKCTYEIPIYQRNYAWERDEISALINDVYDSYNKNTQPIYYIGTLVAYDKRDRIFEVIDGQQRLTTICIILKALGIGDIQNKISYSARSKSDYTLNNLGKLSSDRDLDKGIIDGYDVVMDELKDKNSSGFVEYFLKNVHIIKYMVPRDIDLNHYFEIMNSRGEQLEKHEIVKAQLMNKLKCDEDRHAFHKIWECCSDMSVYLQQKTDNNTRIFGDILYRFEPTNYDRLKEALVGNSGNDNYNQSISLAGIIDGQDHHTEQIDNESEKKDTFQPIIDFPNFLLIVLKLIRLSEPDFDPKSFNLDDKELLNEFKQAKMDEEKIKQFAYTMFKAKYLLDNYIVHHSNEEDRIESNPWKLQLWHKDDETHKNMLRNLVNAPLSLQERLVHLLSMFEVSFTARQRKNYLLYCLLYLLNTDINHFNRYAYADFLDDLADSFFYGVYMSRDKLNDVNKPNPGAFDEVVLQSNTLRSSPVDKCSSELFDSIYGDGTEITKGIPLFIFSYMDYKIWRYYDNSVRGAGLGAESRVRREFFESLGCSDFGLKIFEQFYFSRTRRSLEHYYPSNQATGKDGRPTQEQINCFGNFAMIGSKANSAGSDWSPKAKLSYYWDLSEKIKLVSVASLKLAIMMKTCGDKGEWNYEDIREHQRMMVKLLFS